MHIVTSSSDHAAKSKLAGCRLPHETAEEKTDDAAWSSHSHATSHTILATQKNSDERKEHIKHASLPTSCVKFFGSNWAWHIRICLAVFCALVSVLLDVFAALRYSSVVLMITMDCGFLISISFITPSGSQEEECNSILKLLRLPVMFIFSETVLKYFDYISLFLWLLSLIICDVIIMLFFLVLCWLSVQLCGSN